MGIGPERALYWRVAAAEAGALVAEGRSGEAIALCDRLLAEFGERRHPELRALTALVLHHKSSALEALGRTGEALRARAEMVRHLGRGVGDPRSTDQAPRLRRRRARRPECPASPRATRRPACDRA
jgi:hypothetical protein